MFERCCEKDESLRETQLKEGSGERNVRLREIGDEESFGFVITVVFIFLFFLGFL